MIDGWLDVESIFEMRFFTTTLPVFDRSAGCSVEESGVSGIALPRPNSMNLKMQVGANEKARTNDKPKNGRNNTQQLLE